MTANGTYPGNISGITINGTATDITADITTGKLGAPIQMRDEQLPAMSGQLDQLADQLRDQVNRVHNRGANQPSGQANGSADPAAKYAPPTLPPPRSAHSREGNECVH